MAIYCPAVNEKVLYLTCLECEDKICKKDMSKLKNNIADKKEGQSLIKENNKVEN